jgi:hypothetical protein
LRAKVLLLLLVKLEPKLPYPLNVLKSNFSDALSQFPALLTSGSLHLVHAVALVHFRQSVPHATMFEEEVIIDRSK